MFEQLAMFDVSDERLLSQKKSSTTQARRRQKRGDGGHDAGVFAAGECADAREWNEALFSTASKRLKTKSIVFAVKRGERRCLRESM